MIVAVAKNLLKPDYKNQKGSHKVIMERFKTIQN